MERATKSIYTASRASANVADATTRADLCCDIALLYAKANRDVDALALLERGHQDARAVRDDDWGSRSRALAKVAAARATLAQADIGDSVEAAETFREAIVASATISPERRAVVLSEIARSQRRAGDKAGADATVQTLVGLIDAAPATPLQSDRFAVTGGSKRGVIANVAARALAEGGRFEEALAITRSVTGYQRVIALCDLTVIQSEAGNRAEAATTLKEARNLAALPEFKAARVALMVAVAMAQISLGDPAGAVSTAEQLNAVDAYQSVRVRVAAAESLLKKTPVPGK